MFDFDWLTLYEQKKWKLPLNAVFNSCDTSGTETNKVPSSTLFVLRLKKFRRTRKGLITDSMESAQINLYSVLEYLVRR